MPTIIAIVEGDGEVQAVPILIRRIAEVATPGFFPDVPKPIRARRDSILKPGEIERYVELAANQAGPDGRILILEETHGGIDDDLRPEYDLSQLLRGGVRGRYAERFHASAAGQLHISIDPDDMARSRCLSQVVEGNHRDKSNSDFFPLVNRLRSSGKMVIVSGRKASTSDVLINSCDRFDVVVQLLHS